MIVALALNMRSIPAPAGEPQRDLPRGLLRGVYPRACGGTLTCSRKVDCLYGLSPRLRGNLDGRKPADAFIRSIPAPAGEPGGAVSGSVVGAVYPRALRGNR